MEEEEEQDPVRIPLGNGTYVTKVRGKVMMVRGRKPNTPFEIGMDLLGEAFRGPQPSKMKPTSPSQNGFENGQFNSPTMHQFTPNQFPMNETSANEPAQTPMSNTTQQQQFNLPPGPEVTMGPHGYGPYPNAGYTQSALGHGNRQLALMPISGPRPSNNAMGHPAGSPYPQPWMYSQGQNIYGNALNNPWQSFMAQWHANSPTTHNFIAARHICANCGRLRSRKYHSEHPIIAGTPPTTAFCRKCQKEASSTDEDENSDVSSGSGLLSGAGPNRKLKKSNKSKVNDKITKNDKKKDQKKAKNDGNVPSCRTSNHSEDREASLTGENGSKSRKQDDYIVVEEYQDEQGRRGSTLRINIQDTPMENRARHLSPLVDDFDMRRSRSIDAPVRDKHISRYRSPSPPRKLSATERDMMWRSSLVEPSSRCFSPGESIRTYISEENVENYYRGRSRAPRPHYEDCVHERRETAHRRSEDGYDKGNRERRVAEDEYRHQQTLPSRGNYMAEDQQTDISSVRSRDSLDRTHRERGSVAPPQRRRGELPHDIGPLRDDEVVVVTERYTYRPKRLANVSEEREFDSRKQRQEKIDATTIGGSKSYQQFSAGAEASEYYHKDWNQIRQRQDRKAEGRRRIRSRDLDEAFSRPVFETFENAFQTHRDGPVDERYLPRAPSPPTSMRRTVEENIEEWAESSLRPAPYPYSDEKLLASPRKDIHKAKHTKTCLSRDSSLYRPPYVREASAGGTEQVLIASPGHSKEHRHFIPEDISEATEEIERTERRHVSFREPEVRDGWSTPSGLTSVIETNNWQPAGEHDM